MTNTAGEPIIGATVLEKGNTTNGTITDIDGNFTINLPANATLSISYIGYITQEIQVGYQTSFKVVLKDDTKTVDTETGALWYEEALPAESVLYGLVVATPITSPKVRDIAKNGIEKKYERTINSDLVFELLKPAMNHALQFGGKATVGRGVCRAVLVTGK